MLGKFAFINKSVAKNLGQDESLVSSVNAFFVKELDEEFRRAEHPFIYVRGLGTFTLVLGAIHTRLRTVLGLYWNMRKDPTILKSDKRRIGIERLIFELFSLRRTLRTRRREIKIIKDARKDTTNN